MSCSVLTGLAGCSGDDKKESKASETKSAEQLAKEAEEKKFASYLPEFKLGSYNKLMFEYNSNKLYFLGTGKSVMEKKDIYLAAIRFEGVVTPDKLKVMEAMPVHAITKSAKKLEPVSIFPLYDQQGTTIVYTFPGYSAKDPIVRVNAMIEKMGSLFSNDINKEYPKDAPEHKALDAFADLSDEESQGTEVIKASKTMTTNHKLDVNYFDNDKKVKIQSISWNEKDEFITIEGKVIPEKDLIAKHKLIIPTRGYYAETEERKYYKGTEEKFKIQFKKNQFGTTKGFNSLPILKSEKMIKLNLFGDDYYIDWPKGTEIQEKLVDSKLKEITTAIEEKNKPKQEKSHTAEQNKPLTTTSKDELKEKTVEKQSEKEPTAEQNVN
ncbi:hypothetical protein [Bacillus cereus]|uniref:hypothetical protein n=1 Tax=Bacillus cereus TaxID=1396 RepID=UPI0018794A7D|nr:hypothetical protein [Bacillus cereus]MBE7123474.1 hypothetical protein [Bacillus cereus]